jgi:D-alanyl-D-alanine dipeptidase
MHRFAFADCGDRTGLADLRWPSVACALVLSACVGSPQAAVSESPFVPKDAAHIASCSGGDGARLALQRVAQELSAHGLELQAACAASGPGWVVQVRVIDGLKASKVVRGPLADGLEVDMGTPAGVNLAGAQAAAQGFSPDVQFNRQWLRATMAGHQFDNAADAWWRFAQRGNGAAHRDDTDLAAR